MVSQISKENALKKRLINDIKEKPYWLLLYDEEYADIPINTVRMLLKRYLYDNGYRHYKVVEDGGYAFLIKYNW